MKIHYTPSARTDLLGIGDYIAQDNPRRALSFVEELETVIQTLAAFPFAYPVVRNYEAFGIRYRAYGRYLIFYAVRPEYIVIERVLSASQDYESVLFPDA